MKRGRIDPPDGGEGAEESAGHGSHPPVDPALHQAARRLAWRNVGTIENLLRDEELPLAAREFYRAAREEMGTLKKALQRRWERLRGRRERGTGKG